MTNKHASSRYQEDPRIFCLQKLTSSCRQCLHSCSEVKQTSIRLRGSSSALRLQEVTTIIDMTRMMRRNAWTVKKRKKKERHSYAFTPERRVASPRGRSWEIISTRRTRMTYLVCPAYVRRRAALSSPSSPRACQRQRQRRASVLVLVAVSVGEMTTIRRNARANDDCRSWRRRRRRRRQRLHAIVLAERGGGDGATRHHVRIDASRDRWTIQCACRSSRDM